MRKARVFNTIGKISAAALTVLALSGSQAGCNAESEPFYEARKGNTDQGVVVIDLTSNLPECNPSRRGTVYYVQEEERFYYCDGRRHQAIDVVGEPGEDGMSWLVATVNAPEADCANGGVLVLVGPDSDLDGSLDADEVVSTTAICNGQDGEDGEDGQDGADGQDGGPGPKGDPGDAGADGVNSLVDLTPEPPGSNCANGGTRITSGVDDDRDGELDPEEVDATSYVCNGDDSTPPACEPETTAPCYEGPEGTEGVGACHAGTKTCLPTGEEYGACVGQVLPAPEHCSNQVDDDCNGVTDQACPLNDTRTNATPITLATAETTVIGTTAGATADGPTPCSCTADGNIWYVFSLATAGVVYFDTAGSSFDTSLLLTDASGAYISPTTGNQTCNDDAGCPVANGFTANLQSRIWSYLGTGTYYVSVSGCGTGSFRLHAQFAEETSGSVFYTTRFGPGFANTAASLSGTNVTSGTCGGQASGEDARWIVTCGNLEFFSLCQSDGGNFSRMSGGITFDPAIYIRSSQTGSQVVCNDDGGSVGGTFCAGTGGDSAPFGSRINNVAVPRGLNTVFVDERTGGSGMTYTMHSVVRD